VSEPAPALGPGERVLWQGRAAVGAGWPVGVILALALSAFLVVFLGALLVAPPVHHGSLGRDQVEAHAVIALGLAVVVLAVLGGARVAGPYYVSLTSLTLAGGLFALFWAQSVSRGGLLAPLAKLHRLDFVAFTALIALPLARIIAGALWMLEVWYVITDRRVLCVRGARTLWQTPSLGLRAERSWRAPGGHLVVGERWLRLRDDDPARVLDAVSAG
jgi:hypothetical protein